MNCSGTCRSVTSNPDGVAVDLGKRDVRPNDVSFDGLGIPSNSLISDVNVTIDFETNDGNETSFEFSSNNSGTESTSLVDGDELGDGDPNCQFSDVNMGTRTITFDEDATTSIGNFAPASGSSVDPNCGNVDFDRWETWSTNPGTDWFIRSGSTADGPTPTNNGGFVRVNTYTVDICGCKHASFGQATANGISPLTICPNSGPVTLTHDGSDLNMDDDGFGDELRWFSGSCGGTQIGTGTILTLNPGDPGYPGPGTSTYYCQYYVEGDPCGGTAGVNCASVSVTVEDVTPPTVSCQDIVVSLGPGGSTSIVPADVFLSGGDDCGVITLQSVTPNTFDCSELGDNTVTLTVADLSGNTATCNATVTVDQFDPTDIVTGTGTFSGSCFSVFRNDWLDILDPNGDVLISINDQNQDLGQVNVTLDNTGSSQSVPADAPCAAFDFFYMGRQYTITTTTAPSGPVGVRLYFTTSELNAHITASTAASAPGCTDNDDVNSIDDLFVTRYVTGASAGDPGGVLLSPVATGVDYGGEYVEFTTTQFSEFFLHGSESGAPLPVGLLRFAASALDDAIRLDWATASELDNAGFEVQRSTDGVDFTPIGWVDGSGTTSEPSAYRFDDEQVQANIRYYYRLKQVDTDGMFDISPVRSAILGRAASSGLQIWPNPAARRVSIRVEHPNGPAEATITLTDLGGRRVDARTVRVDGTVTERIDLTHVAAGVYLVRVQVGDRDEVRRLVVE